MPGRRDRSDILVQFGARVRQLREAAGLRQVDLADLIGMDQVAMSQIERGIRDVGVSRAVFIAEALGVDPGALFDAPPSGGC